MTEQRADSRAGNLFGFVLAVFVAVIAMILAVMFVLLLAFPGFYAKEATARRAIENAGFTDVQMGSNHWFAPRLWGGCSSEDSIAWRARAKNAQGKVVTVTACGTLLWKDYTIRIGG